MYKQSSLKQTILEESHFETPVLGFKATGVPEEPGLTLFLSFHLSVYSTVYFGLLKMKANKSRFGVNLGVR